MVCHASYPLNSEKASPPGTLAVYLSGAAAIRLPTTASHPTAIPIVSMFLRFIQSPLVSSCVETVSDARRLSVDQTLEHVVRSSLDQLGLRSRDRAVAAADVLVGERDEPEVRDA